MTRAWQPWHRQAWRALNASTAPLWLLMILAPRWSVTRTAVRRSMPVHAVLGVTYAGLLAAGMAEGGERIDFSDGESVSRGFGRPLPMLAGWTHYLTFDLFVGAWIHARAVEEGINARLALLLTWWAGPAGLTLFLWQQRRRSSRDL